MPGSNRTSSLVALALLLTGLAMPLLMAPTVRRSPTPPPERPELVVLRSYVGQDLHGASERDIRPLLAALHELDPVRAAEIRAERRRVGSDDESLTKFEFDSAVYPVPLYIWRYGRAGAEPDYLVFERDRWGLHPGSTNIRLTLIDLSGTVRARAEFTTGWRVYFADAHLERWPGFEDPVIAIDTACFPGGDLKQVYALRDGRFDLVRVEDENGVAQHDPRRR